MDWKVRRLCLCLCLSLSLSLSLVSCDFCVCMYGVWCVGVCMVFGVLVGARVEVRQ